MRHAILFICPETKLNVQHWIGNEEDVQEDEYESVDCPACAKLHFVNRKTGKLMAREDQ